MIRAVGYALGAMAAMLASAVIIFFAAADVVSHGPAGPRAVPAPVAGLRVGGLGASVGQVARVVPRTANVALARVRATARPSTVTPAATGAPGSVAPTPVAAVGTLAQGGSTPSVQVPQSGTTPAGTTGNAPAPSTPSVPAPGAPAVPGAPPASPTPSPTVVQNLGGTVSQLGLDLTPLAPPVGHLVEGIGDTVGGL